MIIVETTNSCTMFQVPPAELEALLLTHPEIDDAAVIPYVGPFLCIERLVFWTKLTLFSWFMYIRFPDKEAGQVPMAYVVKKPGTAITESQVMDFIAKQVRTNYTYHIYICVFWTMNL